MKYFFGWTQKSYLTIYFIYFIQCNSYFLPTYRPSEAKENEARDLVTTWRPLLKERLVLWNNGGPQQLADELLDSSDEETEDNTVVVPIDANQFNTKLVELDAIAKQLAEKFPRGFGASYLTTLVHGNAQQDFTPAIQATSAPVTAVRFGDCGLLNRHQKPASGISKSRANRTRIREVMLTAAEALGKQTDWLVDCIDEVNKRPAKKKYRQPQLQPATVAVDPVVLDREIAELEDALCAKYRLRAAMTLPNTEDALVSVPTQAVILVAGPRHFYDTITMLQFTNNIPDDCPLPKLFRALYAVRDDDVPQNREESRSKKREHHAVCSTNSLRQAKRQRVVD